MKLISLTARVEDTDGSITDIAVELDDYKAMVVLDGIIEPEEIKVEPFKEVHSAEDCSKLIEQGYIFNSSHIHKEYACNHTLHDAYTVYTLLKRKDNAYRNK